MSDPAASEAKVSRFCGYCTRQLVMPHFRVIPNRDGAPTRVHVQCVEEARTFWKGGVTAQESVR